MTPAENRSGGFSGSPPRRPGEPPEFFLGLFVSAEAKFFTDIQQSNRNGGLQFN
jgi:hypothetical protein